MDAETLSKAMGGSLSMSQYRNYLPDFEEAMLAARITTVNRAAMWCAQIGHESLGLRYMEEIASGAAYEWRKDLGNVVSGDGRRFKGSGPIQLTGRHNFTKFSKWCRQMGYTDSNNFIVDNPAIVRTNPKFGFLAASWYWTVERPHLNAVSDARSLESATRLINGGLNGLADRRQRYNRCLSMGSKLLPSKSSSAKNSSSADTRKVWLKKKVAEHGEFSSGTIKRMQAEINVSIDGIAGKNTWAGIQKWCGANPDGVRGPQTVKAMQKKLGLTQSGRWSKFLVKKLQQWLNDNRR